MFGSLVDCIKFSPNEIDNQYVIGTQIPPVGQMLDFVNVLYRRTLAASKDGVLQRDIQDLLMDTYLEVTVDKGGNPAKFKGKSFEKVLELFLATGEAYYEELRRNTGKTVITLGVMQRAEETVELLRSNFVTRELFSEREGVDIYEQEPIEFEYMGHELKCLPDHFEVHHKEKLIKLYDLKCSYEVEDFAFNYLKFRYDIQSGMYYVGLEEWKKKHNLGDYIVEPMRFIICDSSGITNPLIHETSMKDLNASMNGFSIRGKEYIGIKEGLEELKWAIDTDTWNISKRAYDKKGIMELNLKYD